MAYAISCSWSIFSDLHYDLHYIALHSHSFVPKDTGRTPVSADRDRPSAGGGGGGNPSGPCWIQETLAEKSNWTIFTFFALCYSKCNFVMIKKKTIKAYITSMKIDDSEFHHSYPKLHMQH